MSSANTRCFVCFEAPKEARNHGGAGLFCHSWLVLPASCSLPIIDRVCFRGAGKSMRPFAADVLFRSPTVQYYTYFATSDESNPKLYFDIIGTTLDTLQKHFAQTSLMLLCWSCMKTATTALRVFTAASLRLVVVFGVVCTCVLCTRQQFFSKKLSKYVSCEFDCR